MDQDRPDGSSEVQRQIDDLRSRADEALERADASEARADKAGLRADDHEVRADALESWATSGDARSDEDRARIAVLEGRLDVDEQIIAELQADGMVNHDHAVHLQEALRTSRMIGAAIGIVMAAQKVSEVEAFAILNRASQNTNRKLRALADDVVTSGDANGLPST